ncbi:uncharacterized protein K452DRAFT_274463 [Aplosporella prunicola CBS 121167]|uniref:NIMA interactive protein n=1 Tax=Aplosporella prunicola CBS 121167 TaxID=1176127 RepID=A0A6A6BAH8_9PEZI|nr:uncharacterized protein K452DRAFT_274463 [Aplosporella prunicola CBS 121167]KAF2139917.1 hypothetical protein K452DRAFT_274463 [Aplosporella prunicola CBS 121167]
MADPYSLKSASTYLNNLLLARGLLRNGKPVEFAHPSKGEGGKEATMAQIINVVHDLILRRDRDQEQRDSLSQTLRSVRADSQRTTLALERLQARNDDLSRQLSLAQSSERAAKNALSAAERSARSLREEMLRLKATVHQVRTACANDVRKRDIQIQRLKTHLTAQQRGNKTGLVGASITIAPGSSNGPASMGREGDMSGVDDPEYNLKQETTEFLTQLSQGLSDENDNLIGLVRSTLSTLKELQGLPENVERIREAGQEQVEGEETEEGMMHALPTSYDLLAADMDHVLENLRTLLTNPNFVSIHEVELREEEIIRLREGWERMEARWREAVMLMQSWKQRMVDGGDTVNLDELRKGLGLGDGLGTLAEEGDEDEEEEEEEEEEEMGNEMEDVEEATEEEPSDLDEPALPSPEKPIPEDKKTDIFDIKLRPCPPALKESDPNSRSPRKTEFTHSIADSSVNTTTTNTPSQLRDENESEVDLLAPPSKAKAASTSKRSSAINPSSERIRRSTRSTRSTAHESGIPRSSRKRRSSPLPHEDERSPKLTVQEKLGAAAAEADAAALAAKLGSAKKEETAEETQKGRMPRKSGVRGKAKRRKSTLSPEELEELMGLAE